MMLGEAADISEICSLKQNNKKMNHAKCIAALFDFDGVVVDSESQYSIFWDKVGELYHPELKNFSSEVKGMALVKIYDKFFQGKEQVQRSITEGLNAFEAAMSYDYIAGITDFLKQLHREGVKTAIVTSSNRKKMEVVYAVHPEIKSLVDRILTAEDFTRSKPAPDCYLLGAKIFDTVPENCVVFEDSFNGLAAGRAAGMKVVGLATTNPVTAIADKCDKVMTDFTHFSYEEMKRLLE